MADMAHDAPGPASPKPGDVALQQTSRADSPDKGKLRVFISYSRDDLDFADQLNAALDTCGFECSIDRHGISGGEDWKRRLGSLIREADTVVFALSPNSARSEICAWEVEEAERLGKRILPVICRPLEGESPPPRLQDLNYILFHTDPKTPGSGFGTGLTNLVAALNTDFDWLREHTRYLQRATEWDRGGRPANRLLSGDDIAEAKALHLDFIRASEEEAETRLAAQRKQLEEMAAAQAEREMALRKAEEALKQAEDSRSKRARVRNIAFVAISILFVVVSFLWFRADNLRQEAEEQRTLMEEQGLLAEVQRAIAEEQGTAPLLYPHNWGGAQDYPKAREYYEKAASKGDARAMFKLGSIYASGRDYPKAREWFEKAASKGEANAMFRLGFLYGNGQGVTRDYAKAREWYEKAADNGDADAKKYLEQLPIEAARAGRYTEALQRASAAKVEAEETKREGKPGKETAQALEGVAGLALLAREFKKALTVADRAHALVPDDLEITQPGACTHVPGTQRRI
jgi:TPR repeat protein